MVFIGFLRKKAEKNFFHAHTPAKIASLKSWGGGGGRRLGNESSGSTHLLPFSDIVTHTNEEGKKHKSTENL